MSRKLNAMIWVGVWMATVAICSGQENASSVPSHAVKLPARLNVSGETFNGVVYRSHDAVMLSFMHDDGAASVPIGNLPTEVQEALGYDKEVASETLRNAARRAQEQAQQMEEARARAEAEPTRARSDRTAQTAQVPRLLSPSDVKQFWLSESAKAIPRREMAHDYGTKVRDHKRLTKAIDAGELDDIAMQQSLEWNIDQCMNTGDVERANVLRAQLRDLKEEATAQQQAEGLKNISTEIKGLRQQLRDAEWRLLNW